MPNNPQPVVTPGLYQINIALLTIGTSPAANIAPPATLSNQKYNITATFSTHTPTSSSDKAVQDFTFTDPTTGETVTGNYDYSWGNKSTNSFIISNGQGRFYIITSAVQGSSSSIIDGKDLLDPTKATYGYLDYPGVPRSKGNIFFLRLNDRNFLFRQNDDGTATVIPPSGIQEKFTFNTCFLAGSLIDTPEGPRKVEDLKQGDTVLTYDPATGQTLPQAITWAGKDHVQINTSLPMDMAGYPVRIKKDALADGVPSTDLLITAEHCLFLEGRFVPARMMVNGRSIYFDTTDDSSAGTKRAHGSRYAIFHIETEKHSIIISNNVLTESYLDTGNRHGFLRNSQETDDNVINYDFSSKALSWQDDAAAPLDTTKDFVAPLYHDLLKRAEALQFPIQHPCKAENVSDDPAFQLITDKGVILHEQRVTNGYKIFSIPAGTEHLVLASRAGRPCDIHGPFVDDRRSLGLLIGEVLYFHSGQSINIDVHLTDETLDGWLDLEQEAMRWTDGAATLPLPSSSYETISGAKLLAIRVLAGGPYPLSPETIQAAPTYEHGKAG